MRMREGAAAAVPLSGPDPWAVAIVLRRVLPGGVVIPGGEVLQRVELDPAVVARLGGPAGLRRAFEPDRRRYAAGAFKMGYREGWAVEVDIERGHVRRLWAMPGDWKGALS